MWWVVRHPATKQTRWAIYLFFCSDRTALHLACLGSGVWRGHTLNKLQTDSSVNASPIVLSLYTIPVGRCVLCAHYLSRDAAKRGDSLSQRAAVGKEMKVRCFFGCHVERGQPAHTEGEEKKKNRLTVFSCQWSLLRSAESCLFRSCLCWVTSNVSVQNL